MRVSVVLALRDRQDVVELDLAAGSRVADAIERSGLAARFPALDLGAARVGIWGRACGRGEALREGDRVEIYRPLEADAKEMRRRRAKLKPSPGSRNAP